MKPYDLWRLAPGYEPCGHRCRSGTSVLPVGFACLCVVQYPYFLSMCGEVWSQAGQTRSGTPVWCIAWTEVMEEVKQEIDSFIHSFIHSFIQTIFSKIKVVFLMNES